MKTTKANAAEFFGKTDAITIQNAVNAAAGREDRTVLIPRYNARTQSTVWFIEKAISIPSHVTVILDNCTLVQALGCYDNMFTAEKGAEDIAIIGEGNTCLSGGEPNRLQPSTQGKYGLPTIEKNAMFYFDGVKNLTIRNLHIEEQRWAAINLIHTENAEISAIDYFNIPQLPALYGVVLEHGCKNIRISTLTGRPGSHTIYLQAAEQNAADGDIENVEIKTIDTDAPPGRPSFVRLYAAGGHKIKNVNIDTVIDSSKYYEKQRSGAIVQFSSELDRPKVPGKAEDIENITLKNAFSRSIAAIGFFQGVKDATFENVLTFGDNISAIKVFRSLELQNVRFNRIYYGAGSKPNNSASFISLAARGEGAVQLDKAKGTFELTHFILPGEEDV